ncbi:alpha-amylase [Biomphalaria glabrata]|nr:alpha-amylase [Biomphalaria glabrata]
MVLPVFILLIFDIVFGQLPYHDPHCNNKQVIVHLFNWKWTDIAQECERFLGPKGFCGVQISPPNEHLVEQPIRPWSERYAPVSYKLTSRSGTEAELRDMVLRCKRAGVRIYVDIVINHMAGVGFSGVGSAGSHFDANKREFSGVPYSVLDFNMVGRCPNADNNIHNFNDVNDIRNCNLGGLTDLWQEKEWVRAKIADYMNSLVDIGVAGFRVDAAKHMWPGDLEVIWSRVRNVDGGRPFVYLEVYAGGIIPSSEYFGLGYVTEFTYGNQVREAVNNFNNLRGVVHLDWGMAPTEHAFVFVDNHDNQRNGQLHYDNPVEYKRAVAFTLAFNYGFARVMSSYYFTEHAQPPPHDGDIIKDVTINADGSCGNGWVCEHRWKVIANMVRYRNDVLNTGIENWNVQGDVMWFTRGNVGFFAMGKTNFNKHIYTGLPAGQYCDLISDCAKKFNVDGNGMADISPHDGNEPFVAFTTKSKDRTANSPPSSDESVYIPPLNSDFKRTIILIEANLTSGQDLFIRGGIGHKHRAGCDVDAKASPCSIPIRHSLQGNSSYYDKFNIWSKGDDFLDWYGTELYQGEYNHQRPYGTPAVLTSNKPEDQGYNPFNRFGPEYWIVDVDMDCARTDDGYFEVKAMVGGAWEQKVVSQTCAGDGGGEWPYETTNHWARCGYLNVFKLGSDTCHIYTLNL